MPHLTDIEIGTLSVDDVRVHCHELEPVHDEEHICISAELVDRGDNTYNVTFSFAEMASHVSPATTT